MFLFLTGVQGQADPWDQVPIILARISEPTFPDVTFNILEYGAIPAPNLNDVEAPFSVVDANTNAFRNAIGLANIFGGGVVVVPNGTFITGNYSVYHYFIY